MANKKKASKVATLKSQIDDITKLRKDWKASVDNAKDLYNNQMSDGERAAMDQEFQALLAAAPTASRNSEILPTLVTKTMQQMVIPNTFKFDFNEVMEYKFVPNGNWFYDYQDTKQGSSPFWNDPLTGTGESKTPVSAFSDQTIADMNGEVPIAYEENYFVDSQFSRKIKLLGKELNDFALSTSTYMALTSIVSKWLQQAFEIYYFQRALWFGMQKENYSKIKTIDIADGDYPKTANDIPDATKVVPILNAFITQVKTILRDTANPSRAHLKADGGVDIKPDGAPVPLIYDGKQQTKRYLLIDTNMISLLETYLYTNAFNIKQLSLPESLTQNVQIIPFDFGQSYIDEWIKTADYNYITDANSLASVYTSDGYRTPKALLIDQGAFIDFAWYEASTTFNGTKLYQIIYAYQYRGLARMKHKLAVSFGLKVKA